MEVRVRLCVFEATVKNWVRMRYINLTRPLVTVRYLLIKV